MYNLLNIKNEGTLIANHHVRFLTAQTVCSGIKGNCLRRNSRKQPQVDLEFTRTYHNSSNAAHGSPPELTGWRWRCFFKERISCTRNCPVTQGQEQVMGPHRVHHSSSSRSGPSALLMDRFIPLRCVGGRHHTGHINE